MSQKVNLLNEARQTLAMATKMLVLVSDVADSNRDMTRIQDAATQAAQASSILNQLIGAMLAGNN
jgi:hypothetical protein